MNYIIRVDTRERHDNSKEYNILPKIDKLGLPYEEKMLKIGDYEIENLDNNSKIIVERKIINDFFSSIRDGRLKRELFQMEKSYSKGFLIIVGKWEDYYKQYAKLRKMKIVKGNTFTVAHRLGMIAHVNCRYNNIRMIQVENDNQFLTLLPKLIEKSTDGKQIAEVLVREKTTKNIYLNLLTSFPKIGPDKAKKIKEKYPTFKEFYNNIKKETFLVPGIGKKTIEFFEKELLGD